LLPRRASADGSLERADARVDDPLAPARVQLRRHSEGDERVSELGRRGPPGGSPQARRGSARPRAGPRAGRGHTGRRLPRRGRRHAALVAVAAAPRLVPRARLHDARGGEVRGRRDHGHPLPADARRLALEGAAGGMTAAALPRRPSIPAAWWGMAILIASEGVLFACFIATYFYFRFRSPVWPQGGIAPPAILGPLVAAGCLAATSVPMQLASAAARAGRLAATRIFVVAALLVQCGYFAYEIRDFNDQLARTDIARNGYTSIYYTMLGADHAHVLLGVLFSL